MQLRVNTETMKSRYSSGMVVIQYDQLTPYFNATTRSMEYDLKTDEIRLYPYESRKYNLCTIFAYNSKYDYTYAAPSLWEDLLLSTPFGQPKGISYINPVRYEAHENTWCYNSKYVRVRYNDRQYSLNNGYAPTITEFKTLGILDLFSELGGLMGLYQEIVGGIATAVLTWYLSRELKAKGLKEDLSYEDIKKITDAIDALPTDYTSKQDTKDLKESLEQVVQQNQELDSFLEQQVVTNKEVKKTTESQQASIEAHQATIKQLQDLNQVLMVKNNQYQAQIDSQSKKIMSLEELAISHQSEMADLKAAMNALSQSSLKGKKTD